MHRNGQRTQLDNIFLLLPNQIISHTVLLFLLSLTCKRLVIVSMNMSKVCTVKPGSKGLASALCQWWILTVGLHRVCTSVSEMFLFPPVMFQIDGGV